MYPRFELWCCINAKYIRTLYLLNKRQIFPYIFKGSRVIVVSIVSRLELNDRGIVVWFREWDKSFINPNTFRTLLGLTILLLNWNRKIFPRRQDGQSMKLSTNLHLMIPWLAQEQLYILTFLPFTFVKGQPLVLASLDKTCRRCNKICHLWKLVIFWWYNIYNWHSTTTV